MKCKIRKIVAWLLIASPFVTITCVMAAYGEWEVALFAWLISLVIGAVLSLGCSLLA